MSHVVATAAPDAAPVTMRVIAQRVAERHGLTLDDLKSMDRRRVAVWPRQEAMWEISRVRRPDGSTRYSLPQIGEFFGGRDHTTALYSIRRYNERLVSGCIKSVLSAPFTMGSIG